MKDGRTSVQGLATERMEKEWTAYPVLHFSMAGGKHMEKDALEQIRKSQYAKAFSLKGKTITLIGVSFDVEQERNITEWTSDPSPLS